MAFTAQQEQGIKKQYDPMRKRAQQQESANLQGQNDAMARRAAMQGGGPGGAYEKQAQLVQGQSAERLQAANEGIDAQEAGALNQAREVQAQRDYQTAERLGSQQFAHGEREGTQSFQAGQQQKATEAQFQMQKQQIEAAAAEGRLNREQANKQLTELQRQYDADLVENKKTNAINSVISGYNSKIDAAAMGALLKELGITDAVIAGLTAPKQEEAPKGAAPINPGQPGTYKHINQHTGQVYYDNNPIRAVK